MIKITKIIFFLFIQNNSQPIFCFLIALKDTRYIVSISTKYRHSNHNYELWKCHVCQILICIPTKDHVRDFKISRKNSHCLSKQLFQNQYKIDVSKTTTYMNEKGIYFTFPISNIISLNNFTYFCN